MHNFCLTHTHTTHTHNKEGVESLNTTGVTNRGVLISVDTHHHITHTITPHTLSHHTHHHTTYTLHHTHITHSLHTKLALFRATMMYKSDRATSPRCTSGNAMPAVCPFKSFITWERLA